MISIVIPAYNEEKHIAKCLDSLVRQKTGYQFEVILVDNASTDKTSAVAEKYKKKLNLKIIFEKQKGRGAARATGFSKATGEIILSTDADTVVPVNWVQRLTDELSQGNAVAVTGFCMIYDFSKVKNSIINTVQPMMIDLYRYVTGNNCLSGFNFGILKRAYNKTAGFDRNLNSTEDVDLSAKLNKIGKIKLLRDLPVTVSGRRFKNGLIRQSLPYFSLFVRYHFFKDRKLVLSDIR